jgi:pimeloyl-ACP methyl ester carboxylesterase
MERDADDVAALIGHLSPKGPVTILGNSSGAIVSLMFLCRHPHLVSTLISHEPPAYSLLEEPLRAECIATQRKIYDLYRTGGPAASFPLMFELGKLKTKEEQDGFKTAFDPKEPSVRANTLYWFEREVVQYVDFEWDIEEIRQGKEKLVLANGEDSPQDAPHFLVNVRLGQKVGLEVEHWAGQHLGFASHSEGFAKNFLDLMRGRGTI